MKKNGFMTANHKPLVWSEEANTGLDTIRKILLAKHVEESDKKLAELTKKYEQLFTKMEARLTQKEKEFDTKVTAMEEELRQRMLSLQVHLQREISTVETKAIKKAEEKTVDFGKILIELGKEWSVGKSKD